VGIYAQHGRMRPNRIGVSVGRVLGVDGTAVDVEGLDADDGTPRLDIKPVWTGYLPRGEFREPDWARDIMSRYW
jgi:tRNA (Thr-GGU) A37 N-methylase